MATIFKQYDILLDIKRATTNNKIEVVEGDNGNVFHITLTDNGVPVDLSDTRVVAVFSNGDGTAEQDTGDTAYGEYVFVYDSVADHWNCGIYGSDDISDFGITLTGTPSNGDKVTVTYDEDGTTATTNVSGGSVSVDSSEFVRSMASVEIRGDDDNEIYILVRAGSFSSSGINECEIQIYSGDNQSVLVTTAKFNFQSRRSSMNDETIRSEVKYPILIGLIADATNAANYARPFQNTSATLTMVDPDDDPEVDIVKGANSIEWQFKIPSGDGSPSDDTPKALGTASAGTKAQCSRADHVHAMPSASDVGAVPTTRKVNNKALSEDISLGASDVGAATSSDISTAVSAITEIKKTSSFTISWTASTPHSSDTDSVYGYRGAIDIDGVTADMIPEVAFGTKDAVGGNLSPVCECYAGGVYIWSKTNTDPTILSILVHK